jgi:hypothetical protein
MDDSFVALRGQPLPPNLPLAQVQFCGGLFLCNQLFCVLLSALPGGPHPSGSSSELLVLPMPQP